MYLWIIYETKMLELSTNPPVIAHMHTCGQAEGQVYHLEIDPCALDWQ